ncbi:MAG: phage holin family protein [Hymenobacter sp.]|nr:MAG: phage holin family protein [Hymenobacter sp.]
MGKILIKFLLTAVLTYGLARVLPNVRLDGIGSAAILVIVMGLLNATVKPILKLIGFPITVLTLGIFLLVINVIIVKLADFMLDSFAAAAATARSRRPPAAARARAPRLPPRAQSAAATRRKRPPRCGCPAIPPGHRARLGPGAGRA